MASRCMSVVSHTLTLLLLSITLLGYLAGLFGEAWWTYDVTNKSGDVIGGGVQGLLRFCQRKGGGGGGRKCAFRGDVFSFLPLPGGGDLVPDIMVIPLLVSTGFVLLSLHLTFALFCCHGNNKRSWVYMVVSATVALTIAMIGGLVAVLYEDMFATHAYKTSWSAILTWLGLASNLGSLCSSCVMYYFPPPSPNFQTTEEVGRGCTTAKFTVNTTQQQQQQQQQHRIQHNNTLEHRFYDTITIGHVGQGGGVGGGSFSSYNSYTLDEDLRKFTIPECNRERNRYHVTADGSETETNTSCSSRQLIDEDGYEIGYRNRGCDIRT